jgi:hypothetical protein
MADRNLSREILDLRRLLNDLAINCLQRAVKETEDERILYGTVEEIRNRMNGSCCLVRNSFVHVSLFAPDEKVKQE